MADEDATATEQERLVLRQREIDAPDLYRGRAQSAAGLASTAAAAVTAGALFGADQDVPQAATWLAFCSVALLLASVAAFVAASLFTRESAKQGETIPQASKRMVKSIRFRTRVGVLFGLLAMLLFLAVLASLAAYSPASHAAILYLAPSAPADIDSLCTGAAGTTSPVLVGEVDPTDVASDDQSFLAVALDPELCDTEIDSVSITRSDILAVIEIGS